MNSSLTTNLLSVLGLLAVALIVQACSINSRIRREIEETPRDPLTGVICGAEAVTLPPNPAVMTTSRTACLMIHGFLNSKQDFPGLGEELAEAGITVKMMRLPGHGTTPPDLAWQPTGAFYRAVETEYQHLRQNYDRIYVVGFSLGGALATLLASREEVERLVLVAPCYRITYSGFMILPVETWLALPIPKPSWVPRYRMFSGVNKMESIGKFICYRTLPISAVKQVLAVAKSARDDDVLNKITCPVLLLQSKNDEVCSPKASARALEKMSSPVRETRWYEKSNHILFWDYDSEDAKSAAIEFLTRTP